MGDNWIPSIGHPVLGLDKSILTSCDIEMLHRTEQVNPCFQECVPRAFDENNAEFLLIGRQPHRHFSAVFSLTEGAVRFEVAERITRDDAVLARLRWETNSECGWMKGSRRVELRLPQWVPNCLTDSWIVERLEWPEDRAAFQPQNLMGTGHSLNIYASEDTIPDHVPLSIRYGFSISSNF